MREFVGIIMLVPQAMHLPPWARLPAAIGFAVVGAAVTYSGMRASRSRR